MGVAHTAVGGDCMGSGDGFTVGVMRNYYYQVLKTPKLRIMITNMTTIFMNKHDI
jgi:hypothetical protein